MHLVISRSDTLPNLDFSLWEQVTAKRVDHFIQSHVRNVTKHLMHQACSNKQRIRKFLASPGGELKVSEFNQNRLCLTEPFFPKDPALDVLEDIASHNLQDLQADHFNIFSLCR